MNAMEFEVLFKVIEACVANVGAVEKAKPRINELCSGSLWEIGNMHLQVNQGHERNDVPVKLA